MTHRTLLAFAIFTYSNLSQADENKNTAPYDFLRGEVATLSKGSTAIDTAFNYIINNNQYTKDHAIELGLTIRYGSELGEFSLSAPFYSNQRDFRVQNIPGSSNSGIGDTTLGFSSNLWSETDGNTNIFGSLAITAPTGKSPYFPSNTYSDLLKKTNYDDQGNRLTNDYVYLDPRNPLIMSSTTDTWSLGTGLNIVNVIDPIVLFGGINYRYYFPTSPDGYKFQPGASTTLNAGFTFVINNRSSISQQFILNHTEKFKVNGTSIFGTDSDTAFLKFAYNQRFGAGNIIEPSVQFSLTEDGTDAQITVNYTKNF